MGGWFSTLVAVSDDWLGPGPFFQTLSKAVADSGIEVFGWNRFCGREWYGPRAGQLGIDLGENAIYLGTGCLLPQGINGLHGDERIDIHSYHMSDVLNRLIATLKQAPDTPFMVMKPYGEPPPISSHSLA
jgi:hypothetical protein